MTKHARVFVRSHLPSKARDVLTFTVQAHREHWPRGRSASGLDQDGSVLTSVAVPQDGNVTLDVVASKGDWFSLVLRDQAGPTLYSNAIYTN
jgi:hypothetical protein